MDKRIKILAFLTLLLIFCVSVTSAMAYFSTYVTAESGKVIQLGESVDFHEEKTVGGGKHVVITAEKGSDPVFVRVTAFVPSDVEGTYRYSGENWTQGKDGYWYYGSPIKDGESASIDITIDQVELEKTGRESFDLVVIYEYVPAKFSGGKLIADWNASYEVKSDTEVSG